MRRKIANVLSHNIAKKMKINNMTKSEILYVKGSIAYMGIFGGCVLFSTVAHYDKNGNFGKNLYEGFLFGLFVGAVWPISIPLTIDREIRRALEN